MTASASVLRRQRPGATLLITVLIVGAVALVVSMGVALRGIGELDMAIRTTESQKVLALAEGCLQKSLLNLWGDKSFASKGESFALGDGTCTAEVNAVENDENLREVLVRAERGRFTRNIRAIIDISGHRLVMVEWELL